MTLGKQARTRKPQGYIARSHTDKNLILPDAMRDLMRRRTSPFLDGVGLDRPITMLLQEAYLQGLTDAIDAMEHRNQQLSSTPPSEP